MDRRSAVGVLVGAGVVARAKRTARRPVRPSARLKQSVCRWCYQDIPLDVLCREAAQIGLVSVELLGEQEWAVPKRFGLTCAMANGPSTIPVGIQPARPARPPGRPNRSGSCRWSRRRAFPT